MFVEPSTPFSFSMLRVQLNLTNSIFRDSTYTYIVYPIVKVILMLTFYACFVKMVFTNEKSVILITIMSMFKILYNNQSEYHNKIMF